MKTKQRIVTLLVGALALVSLTQNLHASSHDQRVAAWRARIAARKAALHPPVLNPEPSALNVVINPDPAVFTVPEETVDANPEGFGLIAGMRSVKVPGPGFYTFEFGSAPAGKASWEILSLPTYDRYVAPGHAITIQMFAPGYVFLLPR